MRVPFTYTWIEPGKILAGSIPQLPGDLNILKSLGIQTIISLTRRDIRTYPNMEVSGQFNFGQYPIPDGGLASDTMMMDAVEYLDQSLHFQPELRIPIYVHCRGGIGRTGTILLAYYVLKCDLSLVQAREIVKVRRNYEGNASAIDQGSPQREWIDMLENRH